jgi:signal transduction histidine kinase
MDMAVENGTPGPRASRLLLRGESSIALLGAGLAVILICSAAASGWWTVHKQREAAHAAAVAQVLAVSSVLGDGLESLLTGGDLSAARQLLASAAQQHKYTQLRLTLADGSIIADADPANINTEKLPAQWPTSKAGAAEQQTVGERSVELRRPVQAAGRGTAELRVTAPIDLKDARVWESQVGLAVIGAVAMFGLLVLYRFGRDRMRAMGAIREALLAMNSGETNAGVLTLSDDLGPEAAAWNDLLTQTTALRQLNLGESARQSLGERRRSSSALDEAFDVMSQGLLLLDEQMRIKFANGAAAVYLQAEQQKLIGQDARTAIAEPKVAELLRGWAGGESRRRIGFETQRGEGQEAASTGGVLRWSIRPMRKDDTASVMIVIDDITQQRVAEEAQHQFLAQATHELRTPLTNIRLYVESALEDGENDPTLRAKCLNVINTETRRLERIVSDLLSTAEIEAGSLKVKRDDVHLAEMFDELMHDYEAQAREKNMILTFNLPPKLPTIHADRDKITLALHNLIGNALKYTPDGGSVSVNVDVDNSKMVVDIVDTGLGISEEDQHRIFEKFYRANDRRIANITGSGLGLALARDVVRLHGGDICVQSALEKGSTFTLTLPVTTSTAA